MAALKPGTQRSPDLLGLAAFVALSAAVAALGGMATASGVGTWYAGLEKPSFNPPSAVFGPAWTTLYVFIAVAGWRVWRRTGLRSRAMALFAMQMALNLAWSFLFFGAKAPGVAFVEIVALLVLVVATALAFWPIDRIAALLFAPYAAWVAFASVLNLFIWRLN